jgi:aminoglycoside phosphotransferase (APT) family kinase protein
VDAKRTVTLSETPPWQRLERAAAADPLWPALAARLRARAVHPVLGHGDLAPWNIKLSPQGAWTVLDWERGELTGVAGWDWFHYVLQRAILVERPPASGLVARAEQLLAAEDFRRYAEQTGSAGFARELMVAYLLHSVHVIQPAEGIPQTRALAEALAARWGLRERLKAEGFTP